MLNLLHTAAASRFVREFSMRLFKFLSVGCLSLISLASHAETLNSLYQVREPVSSQAPDERNQATLRALTPWCCV